MKMTGFLKRVRLFLVLAVLVAPLFTVFEVRAAASIQVNPTSGCPGDIITVSGQGFSPSTFIEIFFVVGETGESVREGRTTSDGSFSFTFIVPNYPLGYYYVEARTKTEEAGTEFTITGIEVDHNYGLPGEVIRIHGFFSHPQESDVSIEFWPMEGEIIEVTTLRTDSAGEFSGTFVVPDVPFQAYTLVAEIVDLESVKTGFRVSGHSLSAFAATTPIIDGILDPGEWDDADSVSIQLSWGAGETREDHVVTVYVKNDGGNLYTAVVIPDEDLSANDLLNLEFDNNNDGVSGAGDDRLIMGFPTVLWGWGTFFRDCYFSQPGHSTWDTIDGGTNDGTGRFTHPGMSGEGGQYGVVGDYVFEMSHPLKSGDNLHDFSLSAGDYVNFILRYDDALEYSDVWPKAYWAKIIIAPLPGVVEVDSSWLSAPVTFDGEISSEGEWADTTPYTVPLYCAWGWPNKQMMLSDRELTVRFKNDAEWLYMLYKVQWPSAEVDQGDGATIALFTGPYGPPWAESDSGHVSLDGSTIDLFGWDDTTWINDQSTETGQNNVEGKATYDGTFYWFEFRKKLDSGDGCDWNLKPGDLVGEPVENPSLQRNLLVSVWNDDMASTLENQIVLQLAPGRVSTFPISGPPGTSVSLMGVDFTPGGLCQAYIADGEAVTLFTGVNVSSDGTVDEVFTVPAIDAGVYEIVVVDDSDLVGRVGFEVTSGVEPPSGLVSWWPGDGNVYDIVGGYDATIGEAAYADGVVDQAFMFGLGNPSLEAPNAHAIDNLQTLTIEAWVKLNSGPSSNIERFVTLYESGSEKAVIRHDGENSPGQLHFYMRIKGELQHVRVDGALTAGVFHHVAGTYDGQYMRVYLDGAKVGETSISGRVYNGETTVTLSSNDEPLDGILDEVCVYNRALSALEIRAIYDAGAAGKTKSLAGFMTPMTDSLPSDAPILPMIPYSPTPVQAAWTSDINNDYSQELVLGKPTAVLVYLPTPADVSSVTVNFDGKTITKSANGVNADNILSLYPFTPSTAGQSSITGSYTLNGVVTQLTPKTVNVKKTTGPSLAFVGLSLTGSTKFYGTEDSKNFKYMAGNSTAFIEATYPVASLVSNTDYQSIPGVKYISKDPLKAMKYDCINASRVAQLKVSGSAIGVAIGPKVSGYKDYFTYHGKAGAAGVSFGPAIKGVVVLDGYYTGAAHEAGHIYGLYYPPSIPGVEEYVQSPPNGLTASGVWVSRGSWTKGYDIMGTGPYRSLDSNWVNTDTYTKLFQKMKDPLTDPQIMLVDGIIYKDGTVEIPLNWCKLNEGTADTMTAGDYGVRFLGVDGNPLKLTSFDVSFYANIEPGEEAVSYIGEFGLIATDSAPFSFATEYPSGTSKIELVKITDPTKPIVLAEINLPPTISAITAPSAPVAVNSLVQASASFTDQAQIGEPKAVWDWGDGTQSTGTVNGATVAGSHTYKTPGVYTLYLMLSSGKSSSVEYFRYVVVYDPSSGYVTGGGWINSPQGAYVDKPKLTGKATFGFFAGNNKGAKAPMGMTEFHFQVADLNFHSSSYQWLVVAGANAKYKGTGTINNMGSYGFMLTATDGGPKVGADSFRIKIWDKNNSDRVIYDNKPGTSEDSFAGTLLGGGNIIIHK
jgi:hypothetical protein